MKKLLALLLLMAAPAVHSADFFKQLEGCTNISVTYTHLAVLASFGKDEDKPTFMRLVQAMANLADSSGKRDLILAMGEAAWAARGKHDEDATAMRLYHACVDQLGTKT